MTRLSSVGGGLGVIRAWVFTCMIGAGVVAMPNRASAREFQVVSRDPSRLVFIIDLSGYTLEESGYIDGTTRLTVPGFGSYSTAGEPAIPARTYLIGMPPRGDYTVRYTVERSEPLGRIRLEPVPYAVVHRGDDLLSSSADYRIDPATYEAAASVVEVVAETPTTIRNRRVLPIRVTALTYNPVSGDAVLATRIRVEISFRTSLDSGQGLTLPEGASWDRVFSRILVNPDQSRPWQLRTEPVPRQTEATFRSSAVIAGPSVKLNVRRTGMHRVSASEAIAKGLPAGTQVAELHLFKRFYNNTTNAIDIIDVPFKVIEDAGGVAGEFDGTDDVVFFGRQLREDPHNGDALQKFADVNAYWLGTTTGAQMAPRNLVVTAPRPDTLTTTFNVVSRFERDFLFFEETPPRVKDFYYYNNPELGSFSVPFPARGRYVTGQFTMRIRLLGSEVGDALRQVRVQLQNSQGLNVLATPVIANKTIRTVTISPISASLLDEDVNTLLLTPVGRSRLKVLLNWFEIDYPSLYRASGNVLDFHTGAQTGSVNMTVIGLGRRDLLLFDVTDPLDVLERTLAVSDFDSVTGGYALAFTETVASQKRYILTPRDKITQVSGLNVVAVNPGGLVGHPLEAGVDVLVVSHADYLDEMQRWVTYRRAQGYRVLMVDVEDVFNEFSGGNNHARGIKNFARHFFETGGASFLVLVGDASEDNKKVHVESMPNFVPTESFSEFIAGGFDVDEVVTSDKWYTMLDTDMNEFIQRPPGSWRWFLPDLFVGRLPAGNVTELRVMLDKIFLFETPRGDDFWRRRMIRTADDAWSSCEAFKLRNNGEIAFEIAEASAANITEASMPGGYDVVRFFLSNRFSHESGGCIFASIHINRCRAGATPALFAELNQGATFASFQNHMNRYLMCHEWLITSSVTSPDGIRDHRRFDNFGRPWIAFGMGCHMSDYALHKERSAINVSRNDSNGDAMAELMLFRENAGAVTTYGSTGFEYLAENRRYTTLINEEIFNNTPTSPMLANGRRQARWIFGELMMQSEIENLSRYGYSNLSGNGAVGQAIRYHILGDPMLQIDAGPPRFDVTVDGVPFQSGDFLFGDSVNVVGVIVDEVAIERIQLWIDGIDRTISDLTVTPLVDGGLDASRQYEVRFSHIVEPRTYDIVITASQSPDTNGTDFHTVAEFTMKVELGASLTVNGRPIGSGELVPARADYVFDVTSPVPLGPSDFEVTVDTVMVTGFTTVAVKPDSTQWLIKFPLDLATGKHTVTVTAAGSPFVFQVIVSIEVGLSQVIAYPNPFVDETYIVYTNDMEITAGRIDIFTISGRRVAELEIPSTSRLPGQNAVLWDGRTYNGDPVANGVYFFVINISQAGTSSKHRGKIMRGR